MGCRRHPKRPRCLRVERSPVAPDLPGRAGGPHGRGESAAVLTVLVILAVAGLVLLMVGR